MAVVAVVVVVLMVMAAAVAALPQYHTSSRGLLLPKALLQPQLVQLALHCVNRVLLSPAGLFRVLAVPGTPV